MGRIQITIAADGMLATARIAPGPAVSADAQQGVLDEELRAAGVVNGIDEAAVSALAGRLADPAADAGAVVATGTPPQHGEDARLEGERLAPKHVGRVDQHGTIDYHERDLLHPVSIDDIVATIAEPTAGTPGCDVRGNSLPSRPGQPMRERFGPGVRRVADELRAACAGVVLATDRLVDVVPLYTHAGDVDYASGNLHSSGSLLVQGNVANGFVATADGDVVVTGHVQGGGVEAGGSVHVQQGVLGHERRLRAGTDVTCRHATAARIVAGREIRILDQIAECHLQARSVRAVDGRGSVRGSELRARERIEVAVAGSPAGTTAVLAVGELHEERAELARRTVAVARAERFDRGDRRRKGVRSAVRASDTERSEELLLRQRQREVLRSAEVHVTRACHPGVVLRFGDAELRIVDTTGAARFHFDVDRDIIVREDL